LNREPNASTGTETSGSNRKIRTSPV
jgi:hypothetical protein